MNYKSSGNGMYVLDRVAVEETANAMLALLRRCDRYQDEGPQARLDKLRILRQDVESLAEWMDQLATRLREMEDA